MNRKNPQYVVVTIASLMSTTLLFVGCEQSLSSDDYSLSITEPNLKAEAVVIKEADDYFEDLDIHETDDNGNSENGEADEMTGINTSDTNATANGAANGNDIDPDADNDGKGGIKNPNLDFELNILAYMEDGFENELVKELLKKEIEEFEDEFKRGFLSFPMEIIYYFVDLNGDGTDDLMIMYYAENHFSGHNKKRFEIYLHRNHQYELALSTQFQLWNYESTLVYIDDDEYDIPSGIRLSPNTTNGYHDIMILTDGLVREEFTYVYMDGKYVYYVNNMH
jgi:hypothetical protein